MKIGISFTTTVVVVCLLGGMAYGQAKGKGTGLIRGDVFYEKGNMTVRKPSAKKYPKWKMKEFPYANQDPNAFLQIASKSRDAEFIFFRYKIESGNSINPDKFIQNNMPNFQKNVKNFNLVFDGKAAFGRKGKRTRVIRYTGIPYVMVKRPNEEPKRQEDMQQRVFFFEFWVLTSGQYLQVCRFSVPKLFLDPSMKSNRETMHLIRVIKSQIRYF